MILFQTNFTSFLPHLMSRNQSLQIYMQQRNSFEVIKPERKSFEFSFGHDLSLQLVVGINLISLDDNLYPTSKSSFNTHVGSSLHNRLHALLVCWLMSPWINNCVDHGCVSSLFYRLVMENRNKKLEFDRCNEIAELSICGFLQVLDQEWLDIKLSSIWYVRSLDCCKITITFTGCCWSIWSIQHLRWQDIQICPPLTMIVEPKLDGLPKAMQIACNRSIMIPADQTILDQSQTDKKWLN